MSIELVQLQLRAAVLKDWKNNKITWVIALKRLVDLGLSVEQAARLLSQT
jgi:hypothetical protein